MRADIRDALLSTAKIEARMQLSGAKGGLHKGIEIEEYSSKSKQKIVQLDQYGVKIDGHRSTQVRKEYDQNRRREG